MSSLTLYQTAEEIDAIMQAAEAAETDEEKSIELAKLDGALDRHASKVDRYAQYLAALDHMQDAAAVEIKRIQALSARAAKRQEWLEKNALYIMQTRGWKSLEGETNTLKMAKCPPSVEIADRALIPLEYIETKTVEHVDKNRIKAALKAGEAVPGAALITDRMRLARS